MAGKGKSTAVRNEQTKPEPTLLDKLKVLIVSTAKSALGAQSLDNDLLTLAKTCCDEAGVLDVATFTGKCSEAENWIKSDMAGKDKVDTIPGHWRNTKSSILRAIKPKEQNGTGKSLTEFGTMHELRKELPRKPRTPKAAKDEVAKGLELDSRIGPLLMQLQQKIAAMAALSVTLNEKGLDALQEDLIDDNQALASQLETLKKAEFAKEAPKVTGAQALDVDVTLDDTPDVIDEALATNTKPGQVKHH